ncbi:MAG: TrgA family protein, partial [Rhodobacteraceae bacterium]|nr:TrgA family protein [Paracoccaceae bacterium]
GMKTAVITAAWALFVFAFEEMLRQTLRGIYDGPMEAVVG